jgi:hypothetical protein
MCQASYKSPTSLGDSPVFEAEPQAKGTQQTSGRLQRPSAASLPSIRVEVSAAWDEPAVFVQGDDVATPAFAQLPDGATALANPRFGRHPKIGLDQH